jgi:type IV pilus assembly protein PilB
VPMPPQALADIGYSIEEASTVKVYKGRGCQNCNNTGYRGRVGLYEVMEITDALREMVLTGASAIELKNRAQEEGMITLRGSGLRKLKAGLTTVEEVVRETVL